MLRKPQKCVTVYSPVINSVQGKIGTTAHDQHTPNNSLAKRYTTGTKAETATAFKSDFANY